MANRANRTLLIYSGVFTFLVDAYPLYAASALAANVFARCSFAGTVFPLLFVPDPSKTVGVVHMEIERSSNTKCDEVTRFGVASVM